MVLNATFNKKKLDQSFNFTFRYIDDVLSLNSSRFGDFVDRIYPIELEIKDWASFFMLKVALSTINQAKVYSTLYILKGKIHTTHS